MVQLQITAKIENRLKGNDWAHTLQSLHGPLKRHSGPSCALKWFPLFISYTHEGVVGGEKVNSSRASAARVVDGVGSIGEDPNELGIPATTTKSSWAQ